MPLKCIYSVGGGPSGGKLAYALKTSVVFPGPNGDNADEDAPEWEKNKEREFELPVAINYGVLQANLPQELNNDNCLNYYSSRARDKVRCFKVFQEYGIPHPKLISNPANYPKPFLGRRNKGSQGNGITKFRPNSPNWNNPKFKSDFFVEYIDIEKEFRVHVIKGLPICEFNKDFNDCPQFIHSGQFGAKLMFGAIDHPQRMDIINASVVALDRVGLDFGAVDICSERGTGKWYILEINSAPCLAHEIGYLYAENLSNLLGFKLKKWWKVTSTGQVIDYKETVKLATRRKVAKPIEE